MTELPGAFRALTNNAGGIASGIFWRNKGEQ